MVSFYQVEFLVFVDVVSCLQKSLSENANRAHEQVSCVLADVSWPLIDEIDVRLFKFACVHSQFEIDVPIQTEGLRDTYSLAVFVSAHHLLSQCSLKAFGGGDDPFTCSYAGSRRAASWLNC